MTISLPGPSFGGLSGLFGGKKKADDKAVGRKERVLKPEEIARRFDKGSRVARPAKSRGFNNTEMTERDQLSSLRGALYSKDD